MVLVPEDRWNRFWHRISAVTLRRLLATGSATLAKKQRLQPGGRCPPTQADVFLQKVSKLIIIALFYLS